MKKRMIIMLILLFVVFGGVFGWDAIKSYYMHQYFASFQPPPVSISSTPAKKVAWVAKLESIGTLTAANGVSISPEVAGIVTEINFKSGQMVTEGQPLIRIDDRIERAQLKNNLAQLHLAKLNFERQTNLMKTNATSRVSYDEAQAQLEQADAAVETSQTLIAQKNIIAPFSGKVGIGQVNVGQYVSPGQTMVTLQSMDPLHVNFSLPEQDLKRIQNQQVAIIKVDTYPHQKFIGRITAIDSMVDSNTHNISVQVTLPNPQQLLYPGLFANVEVVMPKAKELVTIPQTAVTYSLFGDLVYVITHDQKDKAGKPMLVVQERLVKLGEHRKNEVAVLSGLKPGEEIVTSGQLKLHNGAVVFVNNSVKLS